MIASVRQELEIFRHARDYLHSYREHEFPPGAIVRFEEQYGIATMNDGCPPDQVPITFENGNTWWKPMEKCERVRDVKTIPPYVRRMKMMWGGIKCVRMIPIP